MNREKLLLTLNAFAGMLEYSRTLPTGTTIGKRWRRKDPEHGWMVCEYVESATPNAVDVKCYDLVITDLPQPLPADAVLERGTWSPILGFANYADRAPSAFTCAALVVRKASVTAPETDA